VSKLRAHNIVVSLDGYATGEGQSLDAAFGLAQQEFMEWFGKIWIWRGTQSDGKLGPDEFLAADLVDYLHVIQVPIVLGRGDWLWEGLGGLHERYSVETVTVPSGATHVFFTR